MKLSFNTLGNYLIAIQRNIWGVEFANKHLLADLWAHI